MHPRFTILKWGVRGYTSHGHVILVEGNDSGLQRLIVYSSFSLLASSFQDLESSSTFLVNGDAYILPYRLHTYLGLNIDGSPY